MVDIGRRGFLAGVVSLFAAPAIVHAQNLMPIRVLPMNWFETRRYMNDGNADHFWTQETTGFVITDKELAKNYDIFNDCSLWTNPKDMVRRQRNPWMDKLKDRLLAGGYSSPIKEPHLAKRANEIQILTEYRDTRRFDWVRTRYSTGDSTGELNG